METGQHECEHEDQVGEPDARHHRAQERYEDKMKIVRKNTYLIRILSIN